jgi:2-oxoglutarate ferredoxin oxidoreductase subunit alpha
MDYSIKIGGEAGQGIQTIGDTLAHIFAKAGCHVFTNQDYESRIRGGHNFYQVRLADRPVTASRDKIDIIIAFDRASIAEHDKELNDGGKVIYDSSSLEETYDGPQFLDIPFSNLAVEHGGNKIMANTVAMGSVLGMLGMDAGILFEIIRETFRKKGEDVIEGNISAAKAGHEFASNNCNGCSFNVTTSSKAKMLIAGNEAIGSGAVASGLKFFSAYPMTPSTSIMNYIAGKAEEHGIIVEQAEDEISAINMVLGASYAGVRSMTATSGGGFALMVEGLSLAGITETPVVIALAQRPGPATGLPTRTEQADLQFALYSAHGEFPRVIFAPGTPEQAFYLTNRAFDISEKYQVPVIILTDQYLADSQWTFEGFNMSGLIYKDYRLKGDGLNKVKHYKRHSYSESGVTPHAVPGDSHHVVVTDSDEHDEDGHLVEDAETRVKMMEKRLFNKLPFIRAEIAPPVLYGDDRPEIVLAGWGTTYGIIKEAVDVLSRGKKAAMLHFSELYPFPLTEKLDYLKVLNNAKQTVCIENNATGQFARLLKTETGYRFHAEVHKYDGRPFTLEGLLEELNAHTTRL